MNKKDNGLIPFIILKVSINDFQDIFLSVVNFYKCYCLIFPLLITFINYSSLLSLEENSVETQKKNKQNSEIKST